MYKDTLETERLTLQVLDPSHADQVLAFLERNKDHLAIWEPVRDAEYFTLQRQAEILAEEYNKIQNGNTYKTWIFKKEDTEFQQIIGSIALAEIVRGCFQSCFMGYKMDEEFTNKGYMREAIARMVEYAFDELNLHRIEANIIPRNAASLTVAEKNGFVCEGLSRKYLYINGKWEDHVHMVRLNENWRADNANA